MRNLIRAWLMLAALTGCSLIPDYKRPDLPVTDQYPSGPAFVGMGAVSGNVSAGDLGWRDFFIDPVLQDLIALALRNNRDLRVAAENAAAANAQYQVQHAALFPTIDAVGSAEYAREAPGQSGTSVPLHLNAYSLGLSAASYELDLFGRIRSLSRQAQEAIFQPSRDKAGNAAQLGVVSRVGIFGVACRP